MELKCGPPPSEMKMGEVFNFGWKLYGRELKNNNRISMNYDVSDGTSTLRIDNVILADIGKSKLASNETSIIHKPQ